MKELNHNNKKVHTWRIDHRHNVAEYTQRMKEKPCAICGIQYNFWQMQFDHIDHRTKKIRLSKARGFKEAREEIAKCRVLCANCHADVSYKNRFVYQPCKQKEDLQLTLLAEEEGR